MLPSTITVKFEVVKRGDGTYYPTRAEYYNLQKCGSFDNRFEFYTYDQDKRFLNNKSLEIAKNELIKIKNNWDLELIKNKKQTVFSL